ncbi:MAG: hypothetical protein ACREOQ_17835 [Gemmatimonadales bacterium]
MRLTGNEQPGRVSVRRRVGSGRDHGQQVLAVVGVLLALAQLVVMLLQRGC